MNAAQPTALATDPGASAWVSANAGAGKTHLLTDRVTRLLLSGAQPARILCLTYTKAAAAEMATRLFDRLGKWALLPDDDLRIALTKIGAGPADKDTLKRARRLFAQALETPGGLKIQTIHSFCQHLLSRFPVEAQIPPRFSVLDERSAGELMMRARNTVLERARRNEAPLSDAVATLAVRAADMRFAEILDLAIGKGARFREILDKHKGKLGFFAHLRKTLGVAPGEDESDVLKRFCAELGLEREACQRVTRWLSRGSVSDRKIGESFAAFLAAQMHPDQFALLRGIFMTAQNEPRKKLTTNGAAQSDPELDGFLSRLAERVVAAEEKRKAAAIATLTEALVTVAEAALDTYDRLKRDHAELDYDDLIAATLNLLERGDAALWVLYKLDGGLDHILVDEAQDTSPEQWRIVEKLTEEFFAGESRRVDTRTPRTLFAVGDEKQSIFSFQGADPTKFGEQRDAFMRKAEAARLPFADLRLSVSRRGAKAVLEFVDAVFESESSREGLTSSNDIIHHDAHRDDIGRLEIWPSIPEPKTDEPDLWAAPVDAPSKESAQVKLATRIAARIKRWIDNGTTLPGRNAPIHAGDIMILVRRRNAFTEEMIRQLMECGVPVAGADRMVLLQQIAILDLVALGRFALLPDDDLNLAALLKSPLVGFSEDDLFALAHGRVRTLWRELGSRRDQTPIFQQAHAFLAGMLGEVDFLPPFEFYARALGKGLRKKLAARLGTEAEDAIDEFLALALAHESAHPPSLESFLNWFEKGASDVKRDMEEGGGAVRVMTVHGAKGLQANIVILPDTCQVPDHEQRSSILCTDDCLFFGVPKPLETAALRDAKAAARAREMREYRRLLYVAATRTCDFLIVCGYETKKAMPPDSWYRLIEAGVAGKGRYETIDRETVTVFGADLSTLGGALERAELQRSPLPAFLLQSAPEERAGPRILRPSDAAGIEEPPVLSPLAEDGDRFKRGLLVHALLAALPDIPGPACENAALAYLKREGLTGEAAKLLVQETFAVMRAPGFAPLFATGSRAEVAVAAELPELNARINGQIDRLAVTDDAVLIVDYKTNRPPPARVEDCPRLYLTQMALYRAALQKIYPAKRIDCALVWTVGARLMALPAAVLDSEIAAISAKTPHLDRGGPRS